MPDTNSKIEDDSVLALQALGWALAEEKRAERLLALTGLTPEGLRRTATEPALQAAILTFIEAYEPDLVACAEELSVNPARLVEARRRLEA